MPFKEESLEERIKRELQFHGPQTPEELGIKRGALPAGVQSVQIIGRRGAQKRPARELLPGLGGGVLCFLQSQLFELGLRIGRHVPPHVDTHFSTSLTALIKNSLANWSDSDAFAGVYMHYLNPRYVQKPSRLRSNRSALSNLFSRLGYVAQTPDRYWIWTSRGLYALARVHENQRQRGMAEQIDKNREILESKHVTYEQAANALGWTPVYAENYRVLAREAGQPTSVFVIGKGWQRLLMFKSENANTKSSATSEIAYWLLRTGNNCTTDSALDWFCRIAALIVYDNKRYQFGCSAFESGRQDKFLEARGYIQITVGKEELPQVRIGLTKKGCDLYSRLRTESRLDETGHYAHTI